MKEKVYSILILDMLSYKAQSALLETTTNIQQTHRWILGKTSWTPINNMNLYLFLISSMLTPRLN